MTQNEAHIALLRGINVGGRNKLPMAKLRSIFESCGATDVRSYIQSGNIVFRAPPARAQSILLAVGHEISGELDNLIPIVSRSLAQLSAVVENNPFLARGEDPAKLHVGFLADKPQPDWLARLDPQRSPPDEFILIGQEVYLLLPNGVVRTMRVPAQ